MKPTEDIQKGIQQLVDLTKMEEATSNQLQLIKMPDLALVMAKYFASLSKLCLTHYHSYSKTAKKPEKERSEPSHRCKEELEPLNCPPKKPLTAYILYFQDRVPFFQQKYPKYTISELTRLIAKQWKETADDVKKPYIDRAAADRKRYQTDKKEMKLKKGMKKLDQEGANRNPEESDSNSSSAQKQRPSSEQPDDVQDEMEEGI